MDTDRLFDGLSEPAGPRLIVQNAADMTPEATRYHLRPYVFSGEVNWLEGPTKAGKTMVACDFIARTTNGTAFINGEVPRAGKVLYLTCEDKPERTLLPRLIAAGAVRDRVSFIIGRTDDNGEGARGITLPNDIQLLEETMLEREAVLLIIDGTFGFTRPDDKGTYMDAYRLVRPLAEMARRTDAAIIAMRHIRKSDGSALDKGIGSVGYGALGRSTLTVAVDQEDETRARRILAHAGANHGEVGQSIAFTIEGVEVDGLDEPVGRVSWGEIVNRSADDIVANRPTDDDADRAVADDFLLDLLGDHMEHKAAEVFAAGERSRINRRTLQRSAKRLHVVIDRKGYQSGSTWRLPVLIRDTESIRDTFATHISPVANGANGRTTGPSSEGVCSFHTGQPHELCRRCGWALPAHSVPVGGQPK